jgi:hypothetical protein
MILAWCVACFLRARISAARIQQKFVTQASRNSRTFFALRGTHERTSISPALGFVGQPLQFDSGASGALFGIVATTDTSGNQIIYFNDDNASTVFSLTKQPRRLKPCDAATALCLGRLSTWLRS